MSTSRRSGSLVGWPELRRAKMMLGIGLMCGSVQYVQAQGGSTKLFAQLGPGNVVRLIEPGTGTGRTIYESQSWSLTNLTLSPTGQYLGVLEWEAGVVEGVNYRIPPRPEFILLDTTGHVVRRVRKDVVNYAWCGAQCLAYIRGTYAETDIGYAAQGAFVLNLSTGAIDSIPRAYQVVWAPFDSSVYVKYAGRAGPLILRYHLSNGSVDTTSHRSLGFSPDGKYYLQLPGESGDRPHLYDARTDQEIPLPNVGPPARWLPSSGSLLVLSKAPSKPPAGVGVVRPRGPGEGVDGDYVVYDVPSGRVVNTLHGHFATWASPNGVVAFVSGGRIDVFSRP